jgi:hypothetical protein
LRFFPVFRREFASILLPKVAVGQMKVKAAELQELVKRDAA